MRPTSTGCPRSSRRLGSFSVHCPLRDMRSILDVHYLHRDIELARAAITKLEMGYAKKAG